MNNSQTDWQTEKTDLSSRFKELFVHSHWTDCAFRVGEDQVEVVRCHRLVLAASSPVFEALFYGSLGPGLDPVDVPDLEPDIFRLMLKYMYCDDVSGVGSLCVDGCGRLLYAANKYMLPHLAAAARETLLERTRVNTLWDVLAYAECLDDRRLIDRCIQVMCQYPAEMWLNNADRIGRWTLVALLDRPATNLTECELVRLVAEWCRAHAPADAPPAIRQTAVRTGMLQKLRVLTLSPGEVASVLAPSGLASEEELSAIAACASDSPSDPSDLSGRDRLLPPTLCRSREPRSRVVTDSYRCIRRLLTKRKQYVYGGRLACTLTADSRLLLTAIEVYTRIASAVDYVMGRGRVTHYDERLTVTIADRQGEALSVTEVKDCRTEFNVTQKVALSPAVWLRPDEPYTVSVELPTGGHCQYPVCELAPAVLHRAVRFDFSDRASDSPEGAPSDFGFLTGLFFSV